MSDLISRADVLKFPIRLDRYDKKHGSREFVLGIESVMDYVESLPSAEKRGHWINIRGWVHCSVCHKEPPNESNIESDYCPNCGAKMEEENETD